MNNPYLANESYDSYRSVDLEAKAATASPYELVLVLFDGLLDELARTRGHIEAKRYQEKGRSLEKCLNILNGLNSALDYDNGGEVVANLGRLYDYCAARLYRAGIDLDPAIIDEVVGLLSTIKQGWLGVQAKHG